MEYYWAIKRNEGGFPSSPVVKNPPYKSKNSGLIPGCKINIAHATQCAPPREGMKDCTDTCYSMNEP